MSLYSPIITTLGLNAIAEARASDGAINYASLAVGDSNGISYSPEAGQTELVNEVWRGAVESVYVHPNNSDWVVCEARIPVTDGGFDIREAGIFSSGGDLVAVSRYPLTTKPAYGSGSEKDLLIRFIFEVTNAPEVTHMIDPSLIYATKEYTDARIHHVRLATTGELTLSGEQTVDGINAVAGDRVLVKNQSDQTLNGIYVVDADAWVRALDFNSVDNILPAALVAVAEGADNGDSLFIFASDSPVEMGVSVLTFKRIGSAKSITCAGDLTGSGSFDDKGNLTLNASVNKWSTPRKIQLSGDCSGSVSIDGSADQTLNVTVKDDSHYHRVAHIDGLQTDLDNRLRIDGKAADSNKLDGYDHSHFVKTSAYDNSDVLNKIKAVDGPGSGLNADLLDNLHASSFLRTTGKAADSNKLDGLDHSAFAKMSHFTNSIEINGYQRLAGGMMLQWGRFYDVGTSGGVSVSFPVTFDHACLSVVLTDISNVNHFSGWAIHLIEPGYFYANWRRIAGTATGGALWIAIGW